MTTDLEAALDRQFQLVLGATNSRQFFHRLVALWKFLTTEPLVAGITDDAVKEAERRKHDFEARMDEIATEALVLLDRHRPNVQRLWPRKGAPLKATELQLRDPAKVQAPGSRSSVTSAVGRMFRTVANGIENHKKPPDRLYVLRDHLELLHDKCEHAERTLTTWEEATGGFAAIRLRKLVGLANPAPSDSPEHLVLAKMTQWEGIASELHARGSTPKLDAKIQGARTDVGTLREDLRLRLVLGRSRLALVRRFAGRCERFEAEELRSVCQNEEGAKPRKAERHLTLRFAQYLYDQGLNPLVDPKIAGLRPDVYQPVPGHPFYVEAKQYGSGTAHALQRKMREAVAQVLDTWGSLAQQEPIPEAFLLVFRRGGPRVELPELLRIESRRLYVVLADIAPPSESGSRNKLPAFRMDAAMLLGDLASSQQSTVQAQAGEETPDVPAKPKTSPARRGRRKSTR